MKKLHELKSGDRVMVEFSGNNGRGGRICNTGYVSFCHTTESYAYFDCGNKLGKYCISINKIISIN